VRNEKAAPTFADYDEERAIAVVEQLLERDDVEMPDDQPYLRHRPTGLVFDSATNLAHFHRGWRLAHETGPSIDSERD
jgi:hypothetical protein